MLGTLHDNPFFLEKNILGSEDISVLFNFMCEWIGLYSVEKWTGVSLKRKSLLLNFYSILQLKRIKKNCYYSNQFAKVNAHWIYISNNVILTFFSSS